jgi:hypothetical protein
MERNMMNLDRRLAELERQTADPAVTVVWVNPGETCERALARSGARDSEQLLFVGWKGPVNG